MEVTVGAVGDSEQIEVTMRLTVADHGYDVGLRSWIGRDGSHSMVKQPGSSLALHLNPRHAATYNDGTRKMVNP